MIVRIKNEITALGIDFEFNKQQNSSALKGNGDINGAYRHGGQGQAAYMQGENAIEAKDHFGCASQKPLMDHMG